MVFFHYFLFSNYDDDHSNSHDKKQLKSRVFGRFKSSASNNSLNRSSSAYPNTQQFRVALDV